MQQPSFIIRQTALIYQYFPKWTCLFLEKKYLNTQEKTQQFREEARRNTNLNIKQNAKPRDIIYQIIEAQRLPTDGEQRFTLVNTGKVLTIKRSSHKSNMTNMNAYLDLQKRFRTETRNTKKRIASQPKKKRGLFQFQKNANILKRKYATRMVLLVGILTMMGIGVYKINELQIENSHLIKKAIDDKEYAIGVIYELQTKKKNITQEARLYKQNTARRISELQIENSRIINESRIHKNEKDKFKEISSYAYGIDDAKFVSTRTDKGFQVWIQKQHRSNCVVHSLNNILNERKINRPISLIEWARDSQASGYRHDNEHYIEGGYNRIEIMQYLRRNGIDFIFFFSHQCNEDCFIERYNSAKCGVLFGTNTHAMCVRKNLIGTLNTFMDSNFTGNGQPVTLDDADAVYKFIQNRGWGNINIQLFQKPPSYFDQSASEYVFI